MRQDIDPHPCVPDFLAGPFVAAGLGGLVFAIALLGAAWLLARSGRAAQGTLLALVVGGVFALMCAIAATVLGRQVC